MSKFISFFFSLFALAAQPHSPENGNLIPEPTLADYSQATRSPGILGNPEDVQDADGNPASFQ